MLAGDSSVEERRFRVVLAAAGAAVDPSAKDASYIVGIVEMLPAWHCDGAHPALLVPPPKRLAANAIRLDDARRRHKLGCVNLCALVAFSAQRLAATSYFSSFYDSSPSLATVSCCGNDRTLLTRFLLGSANFADGYGSVCGALVALPR